MSVGDGFTSLGAGAEFDRLRAIWRRIGERGVGLGDDAAIVMLGSEQVALTSDMAIEDRHFRRKWLEPGEIGWRACAGALSDLAAVAADPAGIMVSIGVPSADADEFLEEVSAGIADAAASVGAVVWGGDLVRSDRVVLDVMCIGRAREPVRRSGASVGDELFVTGRLGGPRAAVEAWERGEEPGAPYRDRFAHPVPRVREAHWLRDRGATAMIDISDGLAGDAGHLAAASGMYCTIDVDRVPLVGGVSWEVGVASGEEYELLVAFSGGVVDDEGTRVFEEEFGLGLTRIGRVEQGSGVRLEREGKTVETPEGFSHF